MVKVKSLEHFLELLSSGEIKIFYVKTGHLYRELMFAEKKKSKLKIFFSEECVNKEFDIEEIELLKKHNIMREIDRKNLFMENI